jgi:uncharacterized protein
MWFRRAADQGDPLGQNALGFMYASGQGVQKDPAQAVKWYRKAAEQGYDQAQYNLGYSYENGEGVATNYAEAVAWYRKAASQNYPPAQFSLGNSYFTGHGMQQDHVEAYKWWLLAAAQGYEPARNASSILEHQLTPEQIAEGQKRVGDFKPPEVSPPRAELDVAAGNLPADLRAKAETGDPIAQNECGEALYAGKHGVARNAVEAVKWFRRAAEQNFAAAQANLGVCFERGDGVAKYEVEAYKWDLLAAAQGDTKGKRNASILELMLSREQIADGKQRADAWLEQLKKSSPKNR